VNRKARYYFTTRDLLMMAALAALGGITSTAINAFGDFVQSIVGFAGTTQWAAGLHVLWLTLAVGLTGKQGAGTVTGLLKGGVELLTGNTHGILILFVDLVAGLLVDLGFMPFRRKDRVAAYGLAGGLAAASNVLVFQLFAALPADVLTYGAMLLVALLAFLSGVIFAGVLGWGLLNTLRRTGVVKDQTPQPMPTQVRRWSLLAAVALTLSFFFFLRASLQGPPTVEVTGAVGSPYAYPDDRSGFPTREGEGSLNGITRTFTGVPLETILDRADPNASAGLVLVEATDGYAFFITMEEVRQNEHLLLVATGSGEDTSYNMMGAQNSKAWVRNVNHITFIGATPLPIAGAVTDTAPYEPADWQYEMDSTSLNLSEGSRKVQGTPMGSILEAAQPTENAEQVVVEGASTEISLPLDDITGNDAIRLFAVIDGASMTYALGRMNGDVLVENVQRLNVQ
jgi:ABC-type thiamin/hydroxymethylpyrimidine transport system permease subunit